ncbi:MAG: NUDIX domain-containing protein [Bacilli bacterium]
MVKREVKEETNLNLNNIIDLNLIFEYESLGKHCIEHVFISYADDSEIILNEESLEYKWCSLNEFIELIKWYYNKDELKELLKNYIN